MLTEQLKVRYCDDEDLTIGLFSEPYFSERIRTYGHADKLAEYEAMIAERGDEEYLKIYRETKQNIIEYIKSTEEYKLLSDKSFNNTCNDTFPLRDEFSKTPKNEIYCDARIGDRYISIDMVKGNFTTYVTLGKLMQFSKQFNNGEYDYEGFTGKFTDIDHIKQSRTVRQVIFGQCAPTGIARVERYLTSTMLSKLIDSGYVQVKDIMRTSDDEIVLRVTDNVMRNLDNIKRTVSEHEVPFTYQMYDIWKLNDTHAFLKNVVDGKNVGKLEVKGGLKIEKPSIYRFMADEEPNENDLVFYDSNVKRMAKLLRGFDISIVKERKM